MCIFCCHCAAHILSYIKAWIGNSTLGYNIKDSKISRLFGVSINFLPTIEKGLTACLGSEKHYFIQSFQLHLFTVLILSLYIDSLLWKCVAFVPNNGVYLPAIPALVYTVLCYTMLS